MSIHPPATRSPKNLTPTGSPWRRRLDTIVTLPGGRHAKWLMLLAVVGVLMLAGPFAGKVGDVEENGPTSQLPRGFDSTLVEEELTTFERDGILPTLVIYHRDGGLAAGDRAAIEENGSALSSFPTVGEIGLPTVSEDGEAAITVFGLDMQAGGFDDVEPIRDQVVAGLPDGLDAKVTGPSALMYDEVSVFDGLDGKILGASAIVVALLLLLTYRSPVLWMLPLLSIGVAMGVSNGVIYGLAKYADLPVNGQSGGLLPILVFGVGTDYALLLIARYRDELHLHRDRHTAMAAALRRSVRPILASAATVVFGLCCLLLADMNNTRSLGAVCAVGVACAALSMLVVLPVLLVILGRWVFWPFVPRADHDGEPIESLPGSRGWRLLGRAVASHPRRVWVGTTAVLSLLALGVTTTTIGTTAAQEFRNPPDSVTGQTLLEKHFDAGSAAPVDVSADSDSSDAVIRAIADTPSVAKVSESVRSPDGSRALFAVVLESAPDSDAAEKTISGLRSELDEVEGANALVGGATAQTVDVAAASVKDALWVVPAVLMVVLLVLTLLLRALVGPLVLLATVILAYAVAMGAGALVMNVLGFNAVDVSVPLLSFVFLVALGVDYTIFLMSRVREEVGKHGHREGVLRGLAATGGVITSAGLVLAATFAVLIVMPIVSMISLGVVVALGILLDTFVVRSLLVPALALDIGERFWAPGSGH